MATEMLWVSLEGPSSTNSPRQRFHSQLCYQIVRYFCRTLYDETNLNQISMNLMFDGINVTKKKKPHTKHWVRFHRGCSTSFRMQHILSEIWRENIRFYVPLITGFFNINPLMQNMFIVFVSLCLCSSSHFLFCRISIFALLRVSCWRLVCGATLSYARGVYRIIQYMQIFQYHTR
jgi:hypothetical protein